jgi:hypothetical protein
MAHTVKMTAPAHEVVNSDIDFWVWGDNGQLGHLHVSKGGVDWYEGKSWLKKRSVTWERFQTLLQENVSETKGKKPKHKR